jgi:hypothetical protein
MLARRLLLLAAVLMLLTALAAGLAPRQPVGEAPATEAPALPAGSTVVREIAADPGEESRVVGRRGDLLQLEGTGDGELLDSVQIEGLDRMEAIAPLTPARFDIIAEAPAGLYPIRLVDADRRIGAIEITD